MFDMITNIKKEQESQQTVRSHKSAQQGCQVQDQFIKFINLHQMGASRK